MKIKKVRKQLNFHDKPKSQNPNTAFLYCTGLRSSNTTRNSVLSQIFDTARNAYCILSDQYIDN